MAVISRLRASIILVTIVALFHVPSVNASEQSGDRDHQEEYAIPPAQFPEGEDTFIITIGADYIYWKPYQERMAIASTSPTSSVFTDPVIGNVISPSMEAQSGFRVGFDINTYYDGWYTYFQYTWFDHASLLARALLQTGRTYRIVADGETSIRTMQSKFSFQFNRLDGRLARPFYTGKHILFCPWLGLLSAWDYQYLDYNTDTETTFAFSSSTKSYKNVQKWWGIGPYAGIDSTYCITNEVGIFVSSGLAMLLSDHYIHSRSYNYTQGSTEADRVPDDYQFNTEQSINNIEPMIEASLGLRWEFFCRGCALQVALAWETQTYFNHNGFLGNNTTTTVNAAADGNYSMQGLTAGLRVNF